MKLFAVYLGGYVSGSHIEMHDVRFVVGEKIEDTYEQLRAQWFGDDVSNFHIDAYMELSEIDGYKISLQKGKVEDDRKLFFIFMGAYDKNIFGELHETAFLVGDNESVIKKRALECLKVGELMPHKDNLFDVDSVIEISNLGEYSVVLEYTGGSQNIAPDWIGYNTDVAKR